MIGSSKSPHLVTILLGACLTYRNEVAAEHDPGLRASISVYGESKEEQNHTIAEHGDACTPTDNISTDYCENAYYPQKGRMFCRGPDSGGNYTCECKFAKVKGQSQFGWVQLNYNNNSKICMSPEGGRCYELLMELSLNSSIPHKYFKLLTESDKQCDNTGISVKSPKYLKCSKPHPRRFVAFDKLGYYCLRKEDRASSSSLSASLSIVIAVVVLVLKMNFKSSTEQFLF